MSAATVVGSALGLAVPTAAKQYHTEICGRLSPRLNHNEAAQALGSSPGK